MSTESHNRNVHAEWIELAMIRQGLTTYVALAQLLGIGESNLGHYKTGRSKPPRGVQDRLLTLAGGKPDNYLAGPDGAT